MQLTLSATQLDACWELLGLDETPLTLRLPSPGRTWAERRELLAGVLDELSHRGLAERSAPNELLAAPLRLLARPDHQVDLRLGGGRMGTVVAIGAVAGERAAVLVQHGDRIRVRCVRPAQTVPTLLGLIGPVQAGVGRPVNMPVEMYDAAVRAGSDGNPWTVADELVALGLARADAGSWARMCTGVRSYGQLGTAFRAGGVPRFGPWVIGFHRTGSGSFLQLRRPLGRPAGSAATVTVCPVDRPGLRRLVEELLAEGPGDDHRGMS